MKSGLDARLLLFVSIMVLLGGIAGAQFQRRGFGGLDSESALRFTRKPGLRRNPNPAVPLAAIADFATSKPARVSIFRKDEGGQQLLWQSTVRRGEHSIPVLGLRPNRTESISVTMADTDGSELTSSNIEIVTDPLPGAFPSLEVTVSDPGKMEPGVTLFNVSSPSLSAFGMLVAVDQRGEVIWYYRADKPIGDARRMRNGNLIFLDAAGAAEIDVLGNLIRRWQPARAPAIDPDVFTIPVETDMFHHEISETSSGRFLTLSTELRRYGGYPSSETDPLSVPETADVAGDVLVEFRADGAIVNQWSLLNILDPYRIGFGSLGSQWDFIYSEAANGTRDWSHANAIIPDPSDDSLIVSLRHQDAVIKVGRTTGNLIWILGNHHEWNPPWNRYLLRPTGNLQWPYHQHAPKISERGTLLLFDNGNFRRRPFDELPGENYSRAVEFAIDPQSMTVSQVWSYGGPDDEMFFSNAFGDADWMPLTGNVLITDGSRTGAGPSPSRFSRIVEVTHTQPARKVFELIVKDPLAGPSLGWRVYRSERLSSLYPLQFTGENN